MTLEHQLFKREKMLFEHALLLIGIPLILIALGIIKNYSAMVIAGGIGLLVVGILVLASPITIPQTVNQTIETIQYQNFTQPEAGKWEALPINITTNYTYSGEELPANDNLILGTILTFTGLLCIGAGILGPRE